MGRRGSCRTVLGGGFVDKYGKKKSTIGKIKYTYLTKLIKKEKLPHINFSQMHNFTENFINNEWNSVKSKYLKEANSGIK